MYLTEGWGYELGSISWTKWLPTLPLWEMGLWLAGQPLWVHDKIILSAYVCVCVLFNVFVLLYCHRVRSSLYLFFQGNKWYVAWARVSGPSSDCGSSGQSMVTTEDQWVPQQSSTNVHFCMCTAIFQRFRWNHIIIIFCVSSIFSLLLVSSGDDKYFIDGHGLEIYLIHECQHFTYSPYSD